MLSFCVKITKKGGKMQDGQGFLFAAVSDMMAAAGYPGRKENDMVGKIILVYLIIVNLAALFLYGLDKKRAKEHAWRISEKALFLIAVIGGAFGALAGMYVFRHKTKHWYFRLGLPLLAAGWGVLIGVAVSHHWFGIGS